ncbi:MAG TPA: hypothetical protein VK735_39860 [Pseudonocardia sp.]|nr:hypothetical protein [Pseudonocardia sp.]HTF53640.1 hypothetical protein [Pseudonocardia sp.]
MIRQWLFFLLVIFSGFILAVATGYWWITSIMVFSLGRQVADVYYGRLDH